MGKCINLPLCGRRADKEHRVDPKGPNDRGDTNRHEDDQSHQQSDDAHEDERHCGEDEVVEKAHGGSLARRRGGR